MDGISSVQNGFVHTLRRVEFACLDKSVKKDETLLFPEKSVNKSSPLTWAGFCVCLHRKAPSPTSLGDNKKKISFSPKEGNILHFSKPKQSLLCFSLTSDGNLFKQAFYSISQYEKSVLADRGMGSSHCSGEI